MTYEIRPAATEDAGTIVQHRCAMFSDMGFRDAAGLRELDTAFGPWLQSQLAAGTYLGWFAVAPGGLIAAGLGLWLMDWPPGLHTSLPRRGNILNVYTRPEHRRRGLARRLMRTALDWCGENHVQVVILHASDDGRPLYESLGFRQTNEMRLMSSNH